MDLITLAAAKKYTNKAISDTGKIPEAPDDGKQYGRQNKNWTEITSNQGSYSPYIGENGNWFEWDSETSAYVDTEVQAEGQDGLTTSVNNIAQVNGNITLGANDVNSFSKEETTALLDSKVSKETGYSLMSQSEHTKLSGVAEGATKVIKTSDITNDSGYTTKTYVDTNIKNLQVVPISVFLPKDDWQLVNDLYTQVKTVANLSASDTYWYEPGFSSTDASAGIQYGVLPLDITVENQVTYVAKSKPTADINAFLFQHMKGGV